MLMFTLCVLVCGSALHRPPDHKVSGVSVFSVAGYRWAAAANVFRSQISDVTKAKMSSLWFPKDIMCVGEVLRTRRRLKVLSGGDLVKETGTYIVFAMVWLRSLSGPLSGEIRNCTWRGPSSSYTVYSRFILSTAPWGVTMKWNNRPL